MENKLNGGRGESSSFDPNFLIAVIRMMEFTRAKTIGAKAGLLAMALKDEPFTAADLPAALTEGSVHRAGAATGGLLAMGLIVAVGRVKSPKENAHGRRVDILRLAPGKRSTVLTWFRQNNLTPPQFSEQLSFL